MENIRELHRLDSPFPKPQALFVDGATLWMSSRETKRFYAVERATWRATWEIPVPDADTVWGVTRQGETLYVVCGVDAVDVDARRIRRVQPGAGFDPSFVLPCPEGMGSHLSHDGASLVLSQWYPQKLIALRDDGTPGRVWRTPHQVVGHCFVAGFFFLATTTDEESDEYFLERLDPRTGDCQALARIGFPARALAFDGVNFWTNHRERNQVVCFTAPAR